MSLLIVVGCLALVVAIATAIIKVSSFYRTQFGFSVWSGVLLLFLAMVLMLIYYGGEKPQSILLPILSAGLCAFTIVRNICLVGWGYGDLGAGKTAFTRGLASSLGVTEPVTSPTYTIVDEYLSGRLPLFHFDMYRLGSADELFDISWEDYLARGGICAVEWSEGVLF